MAFIRSFRLLVSFPLVIVSLSFSHGLQRYSDFSPYAMWTSASVIKDSKEENLFKLEKSVFVKSGKISKRENSPLRISNPVEELQKDERKDASGSLSDGGKWFHDRTEIDIYGDLKGSGSRGKVSRVKYGEISTNNSGINKDGSFVNGTKKTRQRKKGAGLRKKHNASEIDSGDTDTVNGSEGNDNSENNPAGKEIDEAQDDVYEQPSIESDEVEVVKTVDDDASDSGEEARFASVEVEQTSIPSIVFIEVMRGIPGRHSCVGHLITLEHVLTTSFCVTPNGTGNAAYDHYHPSILNIRMGSGYVSREGEIHYVKKICIYPFATDSRYNRDVAVLTLHEEVEMTERIAPANLGKLNMSNNNCFMTGWSDIGYYYLSLRKHQLVVTDLYLCADVLNYVPDKDISLCVISFVDGLCFKYLGEGVFCDNHLVALFSGIEVRSTKNCYKPYINLVRVDNIENFINFATSRCPRSLVYVPFLFIVVLFNCLLNLFK